MGRDRPGISYCGMTTSAAARQAYRSRSLAIARGLRWAFVGILLFYLAFVVVPFLLHGHAARPDSVLAGWEAESELPYTLPLIGGVFRYGGVLAMILNPFSVAAVLVLTLFIGFRTWADGTRARWSLAGFLVLALVAAWFYVSPLGRLILLWFAD